MIFVSKGTNLVVNNWPALESGGGARRGPLVGFVRRYVYVKSSCLPNVFVRQVNPSELNIHFMKVIMIKMMLIF